MPGSRAEIVQRVNAALGAAPAQDGDPHLGGEGAARAIVTLMQVSTTTLPPIDIVNAWAEVPSVGRIAHLYDVLGDRTVACLASGIQQLARLWASAWLEGNGAAIPEAQLVAVSTDDLYAAYSDKTFAPSFTLQDPAYQAAL